jgi:hypothetical protein
MPSNSPQLALHFAPLRAPLLSTFSTSIRPIPQDCHPPLVPNADSVQQFGTREGLLERPKLGQAL